MLPLRCPPTPQRLGTLAITDSTLIRDLGPLVDPATKGGLMSPWSKAGWFMAASAVRMPILPGGRDHVRA